MMRRTGQGESSRKSSSSDENEHPFKKAKYVWQLKGKYHLKEQYKHPNVEDDANIEEQENVPCNEENHNNKCTCINRMITHSNSMLENDDTSDEESPNMDETPVSLTPRRERHDDYLEKWQARQMVKSFIDNTINTTLEQWKLAPTEALDFSEIENSDSGLVEDEGIMMAIQSHGLQSSVSRPEGQNQEVVEKSPECANNIDTDMVCESEVGKNEADQMDFLSTAVTMAIQKKGLSSYSYG